MPYNTRRISLSLPSLGVHLPGSNSGRNNHNRSLSTPSDSSILPPNKRLKRAHTLSTVTTASPTAIRKPSPPKFHSRHSSSSALRPSTSEHTPPPSPPRHGQHGKLDTDGISDDIVVGVLKQLEKTRNRPHLIKELVAALINSLRVVESSTNPAAIISSRLTNYLKRPWSAIAPCPLAKEQTTTHPRAVYYYLTTTPRQHIPEFITAVTTTERVITPSVSSGPEDDDDHNEIFVSIFKRRRSPSTSLEHESFLPSSELDLHTHHFSHCDEIVDLSSYHPNGADADFTLHDPSDPQHGSGNASDGASAANISHNRRALSPALERDEREFTQTASVMQQRRQSERTEAAQQQQQAHSIPSPSESISELAELHHVLLAEEQSEDSDDADMNDEKVALRNREAAAALFGQSHHLLHNHQLSAEDAFDGGGIGLSMSSPVLRPLQQGLQLLVRTPRKESNVSFDSTGEDDGVWGDLKSAESVELAELDDLLGGY